jgi:hypothetical protein
MSRRTNTTSSAMLESSLSATNTMVVRVTGRGEPGAVCVLVRPLPGLPDAASHQLFCDWDIGATSIVSFEPTDQWAAAVAALEGIAHGAAAMELGLVRAESWHSVSLELNAIRDGAWDVTSFMMERGSMRSTWSWRGLPEFCKQRAVPLGADDLDCLSALALLVDTMVDGA